MNNPFVLGRLLWRPASLGLFFFVLLAPFLSIIDTLSIHGPTFGTSESLWRFVILLPAAVGIALSLITVEALHTQFAWTLPRFRPGIFTAKLVAMILVSGIVAFNMRYNDGMAAFVPPLALGALFFTLGGVAADPLSSKIESRGVLLILVVLALRPEHVQQVAGAQPVVVGVIAVLLVVLLLRREFAVDRARERPFVAAMPIGDTTESTRRAYWARTKPSDAVWSRPLARVRMTDWLLAANYEVFGETSGGFLRRLLVQFLFIGSFAYYLGTPGMVAYIPAVTLAFMGLQLHGRFLYPLSRSTRAGLLFWGSLLETAAVFTFAAVALAVLHAAGPRPGVTADGSPAGAMRLALFIFALAPIGHWARVGRPLMSEQFSSLRHTVIAFALMALWIVAAILLHEFGEDLPLAYVGALTAALAVTTYTAFWFALRWYYARRDIVFVPVG